MTNNKEQKDVVIDIRTKEGLVQIILVDSGFIFELFWKGYHEEREKGTFLSTPAEMWRHWSNRNSGGNPSIFLLCFKLTVVKYYYQLYCARNEYAFFS